MKRWFSLAVLVVGCTTISSAAEPVSPTPDAQAASVPATRTQTSRAAAPRSPTVDRPLPPNCQAPLVVIEELSRFLVTAATHATTSSACVDGPGRRISIDHILVCPARADPPARGFAAQYTVSEFREGDTRACEDRCPDMTPSSADHRFDLQFVPARGGMTLRVPSSVPGLPADATSPMSDHDGDCYGHSPAFVPATLRL